MMMNEAGHLSCQNDMDGDDSECKDIDASHDEDWDDDFKKDLECESESHTTSTPKLKSNLEEVIELVIQDAIDYANSPEAKRILPHLTRKPAKSLRSKSIIMTNPNVNNPLTMAQNVPQSQVSLSSNSNLMSANINSQSSFHPLLQQNLNHGMQHMLQLAAVTGKGNLQMPGGGPSTTSAHQHSNSISQSHQQITNAMMGFSAAQLPNMIMPSYNTSLSSNYSQQNQNSQYSIPLSHIQLTQQKQQQQQQSQLILGNNQNTFSDLSTSSSNSNFNVGISSSNPQLMQSYSVSPYHIPGMMQTYANQAAADLSLSGSLSQQTNDNPACFLTSSSSSSKTGGSNAAVSSSSPSSNQNLSSSSSLAATFELQQTQLFAQQRLLQQQQQQQNALFPDYAAVMARYSAYH